MTAVQTIAAQGDLLVLRVESMPGGLEERAAVEGAHVVAHSETGHHHVATPVGDVSLRYWAPPEDDTGPEAGLVAYLQVVGEGHAELRHLRGWDTHQTISLPPGMWQLRRQREHTVDGWRRVED